MNKAVLGWMKPETSMEAKMAKWRLSNFRHVLRSLCSLQKKIMLKKLEGNRKKGSPNIRWTDSIKGAIGMSSQELSRDIEDRMLGISLFHRVDGMGAINAHKTNTPNLMYFMDWVMSFFKNEVKVFRKWYKVWNISYIRNRKTQNSEATPCLLRPRLSFQVWPSQESTEPTTQTWVLESLGRHRDKWRRAPGSACAGPRRLFRPWKVTLSPDIPKVQTHRKLGPVCCSGMRVFSVDWEVSRYLRVMGSGPSGDWSPWQWNRYRGKRVKRLRTCLWALWGTGELMTQVDVVTLPLSPSLYYLVMILPSKKRQLPRALSFFLSLFFYISIKIFKKIITF